MKTKLALLIVAILVLFVYACKKENSANLIGKWKIAKIRYNTEQDTTINGIATDYYDFGSDGTLTIQDHDDLLVGKYNLEGSNGVGMTIYTVDGHGLGVYTPPSVYTISHLTASSVTLTSPANSSGQEIVYLQK